MARAFGGRPDATSARAERIDGNGIDVVLATPGGPARARIGFVEPVADPDGLRAAFAALAHGARIILAAANNDIASFALAYTPHPYRVTAIN